jgi:hypothetical protein
LNQAELRSEPRVLVDFPGTLTLDNVSAPCVVQNMCSRGFLIKYTEDLQIGPIGQLLQLKCELLPGQSVECSVQVRHVNRQSLGARVVEMSGEAQELCQRFLKMQLDAGVARRE